MDIDSPFGSTRRIIADGQKIQIVELEALSLKVHTPERHERRLVLDLPAMRLGKGPENDVVIHDESVSREHATLKILPDGVLLTDLGSTNGTFVKGIRVQQAVVPLPATITIGATTILVERHRRELKSSMSREEQLGQLIGRSEAMREVYGLLSAVADSSVTVLLLGESGTGKEVTARTLHELSGRSGPFVAFDCASRSPDLIQSELFGHEAGAFTGASRDREGAFRRSHRGTLFLDELGELPLDLQPNLLRVLESREVQPLGKDRPVAVDVRVVAATHRDLAQRTRSGQFREDLYHRIAVIPIILPPLRERREDIPLLVERLVDSMGIDCRFSEEAIETLKNQPWSGNVRSLRNVLERCGVLCRGKVVRPEDLRLDPIAAASGPGRQAEGSGAKTLAQVEKETILAMLEATGGRRREAARRLAIDITTLRRKLKEYGIASAEGSD